LLANHVNVSAGKVLNLGTYRNRPHAPRRVKSAMHTVAEGVIELIETQ